MDGYEAVRKTSGWRDRSEDGRLRVTGTDRVAWLQGLLTNDVAALAPGGGCYAAYLTAQGRMIADVRVLARPDHLLLDVPAAQRSTVFDRLSMFIITEDVAVENLTDTHGRLSLHGPTSAVVLARSVEVASGDDPMTRLATLAEHANVTARFRGHELLVAGARDLGVEGFDLYVPVEAKADLATALTAGGASAIGDAAWHTLRVEAGRPLFGVDMTTETIPLEAGIEERAISFTKGCYVGQEIIIRVVHRGGGRVARTLVGLRPSDAPGDADSDAADEAAAGAGHGTSGDARARGRIDAQMPIASGDRSIGQVTSAAWSPRLGRWIAMGYVHRDFAEPGTAVSIGGEAARVTATVVALPHVARREGERTEGAGTEAAGSETADGR